MRKIYKIKINEKIYEVELEEVKTVDGKIEETKTVEKKAPVAAPAASTGNAVTSPMPGVIVDVKVKVGDTVKEGDLVAILEAMKMETEIFSGFSGTVSSINAEKGQQVQLGDKIITL